MKKFGLTSKDSVKKEVVFFKMQVKEAYTKFFEIFKCNNYNSKSIVYLENQKCSICDKIDDQNLYDVNVFKQETSKKCMKCFSKHKLLNGTLPIELIQEAHYLS